MIRVLIIENQVLQRERLAYILEQEPIFNIVGKVENGFIAIEICKKTLPDVILIDENIPKINGVQLNKVFKTIYPYVKIIMLLNVEKQQQNIELVSNYSDGFLVKDVKSEQLKMTVEAVANDFFIMHKHIYKRLLNNYTIKENKTIHRNQLVNQYNLTDMEIEIIKLIVEGNTNKQIAQELSFSEGTVKNKVSNILSKIDVKDRTQLVVFALKNEIVCI